MVEKGNIVRKIGCKEIYEVIEVVGTMILAKPIDSQESPNIPLLVKEVEVLIEDETEAFNILFKKND